MATMKNQFSELRNIHDNQLKMLEETRQTSKLQLDQWEAERIKLVCITGLLYVRVELDLVKLNSFFLK